jgi:hypothetical protein
MPCSLGSTLDETLGILRHLLLVKEGAYSRKGLGLTQRRRAPGQHFLKNKNKNSHQM